MRLINMVAGAAVLSIVAAQRGLCADVVGLVSDTQGRPVANVKIVVKNMNDKVLSEARSGEDGRYGVTGLAPGRYTYTTEPISSSGLKPGSAVSYLSEKGLTINWHLSGTASPVAVSNEGTQTVLAGDPFGFSALTFTGIVLGGGVFVGGSVAGGYAAAGGFSGSPASPSL